MRLLLPINEAATAIGVGRTKIYELIAEGRLELVHIGSKSLITASSIQALVAKLTEVANRER